MEWGGRGLALKRSLEGPELMEIGQSLWDKVELGIDHPLCVEGTMLSLSWVLGSGSSPWSWVEVTF